MRRLLAVLTVLLSARVTCAQVHGAAGFSAAMPNYSTSDEGFRISPGVELLLERGRIGIHGAAEWTNRQTQGTVAALHANVTWRIPFATDYSLLVGAGSTRVKIEAGDERVSTWNAELEVARRFRQAEVFVRARQYSYPAGEFRGREFGGSGPAIGGGFRLKLF